MLDPCKSCVQKYGAHDINSLNSCCFTVCKAYLDGTGDVEGYNNCKMKCNACVQMDTLNYGKTPCTMRLNEPVVWDNVQRPFFRLYKGNKEEALKKCKEVCGNLECKENCEMDANSLSEPTVAPEETVEPLEAVDGGEGVGSEGGGEKGGVVSWVKKNWIPLVLILLILIIFFSKK